LSFAPSTFNPKVESPVEIVGSNTFGRNPKISPSQTFNMFVSDDWLVNSAGYQKRIHFGDKSNGRANYTSFRGGFTLVVRGNQVFRVTGPKDNLLYQLIFNLGTFFGRVSIDENIAYQIAICDEQALWIYDYRANTAVKAVLPINTQTGLPIVPGYVTYHMGYFIVTDLTSSNWYLSPINDGSGDWNWGAGSVPVFGTLQQKADVATAAIRMPGEGNVILVFGNVSGNYFYNNGAQLFPYQLTNSTSIDYGCLSTSTIAAMDEFVVFLGANEKSGPALLVSKGGPFDRISTDGIDFLLDQLVAPHDSVAFFNRIDGHVFYHITFYNPADNITLIYDFETEKFFYLTDENMNHHIAADIAYFNDTYYFVSLNDGDLYEMSSVFTQYDYSNPGEAPNQYLIPRMRVCQRIQAKDSSQNVVNSFTFPIEQGVDTYYQSSGKRLISTIEGVVLAQIAPPGYVGQYISTEYVLENYQPRIDLTISKDGGYTFGNASSKFLNPLGVRKNRIVFWGMGLCNELVMQLRFWSKDRVTVGNGLLQFRTRDAA